MEGLCDKPYKGLYDCGYLFKSSLLCISLCFLRLSILDELHGGTLGRHFGRTKTLALVKANLFWSKLEKDVARSIERCNVYHMAKIRSQSAGLYTPLPVPITP